MNQLDEESTRESRRVGEPPSSEPYPTPGLPSTGSPPSCLTSPSQHLNVPECQHPSEDTAPTPAQLLLLVSCLGHSNPTPAPLSGASQVPVLPLVGELCLPVPHLSKAGDAGTYLWRGLNIVAPFPRGEGIWDVFSFICCLPGQGQGLGQLFSPGLGLPVRPAGGLVGGKEEKGLLPRGTRSRATEQGKVMQWLNGKGHKVRKRSSSPRFQR